MSVAKISEISASSTKSYEDAIETGIARANKTLNGIKSAWVKDHQVLVKDGNVTEHRVVLKITFILD
jgi:flavin-binding protein dodecin